MSKKQKNKGKRDGTPEIAGSPANEMFMEDETQLSAPEKKNVIVDEEILRLAIKNEDLNRLRETLTPFPDEHGLSNIDVMVRKSRRCSDKENAPPRKVAVAHPAPVDAPLQPTGLLGAAGPRYDETGIILPHSILGSVENFLEEGVNTGELPDDVVQQQLNHALPAKLGEKYVKSKKSEQHPKMESVNESNALKNWEKRMADRKRQQGYLSKLLNKPVETLVMNQADAFRQTQELRHLIDKAIPSMDYGKGYRIGSEFWKQHESLGDDIGGVKITPGQAEKGYPAPVEYIGVPKNILREKGSSYVRPPTGYKKPWHKAEYLHERKNQLQPIIDELGSHQPDLLNLEIVGKASNRKTIQNILNLQDECLQDSQEDSLENEETPEGDCLSGYPDVYPEPVFGPSIKFAGQPARWTGDSVQFKDQVGIEARITFEAYETRRTTSHLEIVNDGTTCIYYSWRKKQHKNPFDIIHSKVQRFYFDINDGVILPGDTKRFPFVFKSPNAGVFMEQWEYQTHPTVYGGASLLVTLRGVALQEDKMKTTRSEIEAELAQRQTVQIVQSLIYNIISGIRTPERPSSPIDAHITTEEIFQQKNANLKYHRETIQDLQEIYSSLFSEESENGAAWDLDISSLKQYIMALDEEDDHKQEFLHKLNQAVANLSFPTFSPLQEQMYSVCYHMLARSLDSIVDGIQKTKMVLGIQDSETGAELPSDANLKKRASTVAKTPKPESKDPGKDKKGGSKKEEKLTPKPPSSKETAPKGGKMTPSSTSTQKRPGSKTSPSEERITSAGRDSISSPSRGPSIDPVLQNKYKEKIYVQAYAVLSEFVDQVSAAFVEIESQSHGSPLASFANSSK